MEEEGEEAEERVDAWDVAPDKDKASSCCELSDIDLAELSLFLSSNTSISILSLRPLVAA